MDMVIANGENCAEPNGIDKESAISLFDGGVDVITTGNHVWRKNNVFSYLDDEENILRPLNFPSTNPGHGATVIKIDGIRILCMNVLGSAYMEASGCPFEAVEKALNYHSGEYDFAVLDIHAEATGEKKAIAYNFADRVSVAFGTHTHVQTNDAQILPKGTGYITDLGMTGPLQSVLGVEPSIIIDRFKNGGQGRFISAEGKATFEGIIFDVDPISGKTTDVEIIRI